MQRKNIKLKLKNRGEDLYFKYFYNSNEVLENIIKEYDEKGYINDEQCEVIFYVGEDYYDKIQLLIRYFSETLKEIKYIDENVINNLFNEYNDTINILKNSNTKAIRSQMIRSAKLRSKERNMEFNLETEKIKLPTHCSLLGFPLSYDNKKRVQYNSATIDRIDNNKGYTKDNIQIISYLANCMKSEATKEQLITFSKNVLETFSDLSDK